MAIHIPRSKTLILLSSLGAVVLAGSFVTPAGAKHQMIRWGAAKQLDQLNYENAPSHSDQLPGATILDRTALLEDAKRRKPWNMTAAERGMK